MVSFKGKLISHTERLGDILRSRREKKGASVKDIANKLGMPHFFVDWIESGKYYKLPGEIYTKNFIKRYAELVGLDGADAVRQYAKECPVKCEEENSCKKFRNKFISFLHPIFLKRFASVVLLVVVVGYVGLQMRNIFSPPPLFIENPYDGLISKEASVQMVGRSLPETKIQINGREMITDTQGHFVETLDLAPGMNTFTIVAVKKHGARTTAVRNIVLEEKVSVALPQVEIH